MTGARGVDGPAEGSAATVRSVNVGGIRTVTLRGRAVRTALWKAPVAGPVAVRGVNLAGDRQADRSVHGGPDKAVYAYEGEDLAWWAAELGRPVEPGTFGENLTTAGIRLAAALIGERWAVGTAVLEVTSRASRASSSGSAWATALPGALRARRTAGGLPADRVGGRARGRRRIRVETKPDHGVTVGLVERAYHLDRSLVPRLLEAPSSLSPGSAGRAACSGPGRLEPSDVRRGVRRGRRCSAGSSSLEVGRVLPDFVDGRRGLCDAPRMARTRPGLGPPTRSSSGSTRSRGGG
jgi:MOSC domain-containing protein YiiM